MNYAKKRLSISTESYVDSEELEYGEMELLERLETLREDMEDLKVTTAGRSF